LLEQAAESAAVIHNASMETTSGLAEYDLPPFEMRYQYFLDNIGVIDAVSPKDDNACQ